MEMKVEIELLACVMMDCTVLPLPLLILTNSLAI